jgi:hypothetical protein
MTDVRKRVSLLGSTSGKEGNNLIATTSCKPGVGLTTRTFVIKIQALAFSKNSLIFDLFVNYKTKDLATQTLFKNFERKCTDAGICRVITHYLLTK